MYLLYSVNVYIFNVVIEIKFYSILFYSILFYCRNTYQVSFRETDTTPQPKKWSAYENPHACKVGKSTRYRTSAQTVLFATSIPGMDSDDSSSFSVATSAAVPFLMQNSELRRCRNRLHKRHRLCSVTSFHCISLLLMIFSTHSTIVMI